MGNGKTPHVDSSVYGWWKAKGHRCYRKKGECTIDAKVKEYPCKGHSRCTIAAAKSFTRKPCTKSGFLGFSNLDLHPSTLHHARFRVHDIGGHKIFTTGDKREKEENTEEGIQAEEKEVDEEVEEKEEEEEVEEKEQDPRQDEVDKESFLAEVRETLEGLAAAEAKVDKRRNKKRKAG